MPLNNPNGNSGQTVELIGNQDDPQADVNAFSTTPYSLNSLVKLANNLLYGILPVVNYAQYISGRIQETGLDILPFATTMEDNSGVITAANTSQTVCSAEISRRYLLILNCSENNVLWLNFGAAATIGQPSIRLDPLGSFIFEGTICCNDTVNLIGSVANSPYTIKQMVATKDLG